MGSLSRIDHPASAATRFAAAKRAYTVRNVPLSELAGLRNDIAPKAGDIVLARVEQLGQHQHLEDAAGRRAKMWPGDEILVAYGNRYAPDQFEAYVPANLQPCNLVAGGGVAAAVASRHPQVRAATQIAPIGLATDAEGCPLNLRHFALEPLAAPLQRPPVIAAVGGSMNTGKTTTACGLVRGLRATGMRPAAAKVTGTGSGGDRWAVADAGAIAVLDFTDFGFVTTFGVPVTQIEMILAQAIARHAKAGAQAIVIEIADGVLQQETAALLGSARFGQMVDAVVYAAESAMSASAGVAWLEARGVNVAAVSGLLTTSPLAMREATEALAVPVLRLDALCEGGFVRDLVAGLRQPVAA
ncbi:MAG: hypothetical protein KGK10_09535 [Rhodospirillales bacterium]|nr:hypothetical protein [Rhodospirillales bacterium]